VEHRGRPIAVFRESGTDLATGKQVAFSWWLNEDVLHKADTIEVVEMDNTIIITLDHTGRDLPETLIASARCKHGILEIRVERNPNKPSRSGKGKRNVGMPLSRLTSDDLVTAHLAGHKNDDSRFHSKRPGEEHEKG
jgi:hypothetical protein